MLSPEQLTKMPREVLTIMSQETIDSLRPEDLEKYRDYMKLHGYSKFLSMSSEERSEFLWQHGDRWWETMREIHFTQSWRNTNNGNGHTG